MPIPKNPKDKTELITGGNPNKPCDRSENCNQGLNHWGPCGILDENGRPSRREQVIPEVREKQARAKIQGPKLERPIN